MWVHDCIKAYLAARGFEVVSISPTSIQEKHLPFDMGFGIKKGNVVKRFGLQMKRPYVDGKGYYWRLKKAQHSTLESFSWIFYGLPTFVDIGMQDVACHHLLILRRVQYKSILRRKDAWPFCRWGGFVESLERCTAGQNLSGEGADISPLTFAREYGVRSSLLVESDFTDKRANIYASPPEESTG